MLTNVEVPADNLSIPLVRALIPSVNEGTLLFNEEVPCAKAEAPLVKAVLFVVIVVKPLCKVVTPPM